MNWKNAMWIICCQIMSYFCGSVKQKLTLGKLNYSPLTLDIGLQFLILTRYSIESEKLNLKLNVESLYFKKLKTTECDGLSLL